MSDWPFPDPEDTVCMTLWQILRGEQPILQVHRYLDDGMFLFSSGGRVSKEDARLVSLGSMLERDASLRGVAALPPGGTATRLGPSAAWKWTLPGQEDMRLGRRVEDRPGGWTAERYEAWLDEAVERLRAKRETLRELHGIGSYPRFDCDLEAGTLTFSGDARGELVALVQVVGSYSALTDTWLWGWANPHLPQACRATVEAVRSFGEERGLLELTTPKWTADEASGWAMTAAAALLLDASGAYRTPTRTGALFVLLGFDPGLL